MYDEKELKWYDAKGVARPKHIEHGLEDTVEHPLGSQLPKMRCSNWRRQGNFLLCDTEFGVWSQYLDPAYICLGDGDDGLPVLHKVV